MIPVQRPELGEAELQAIGRVFDTRWLGMGSTTKAFEDEITKRLDGRRVFAVSTGTAALHLALHVAGVGPGDEVILPSLTFVASAQAVLSVGARPVFCEIDEDTLTLDLRHAASLVSPATRAIMPVHFGGWPCDMDAVAALASTRGIRVVEDAAHAFGSNFKGRPIGSFGDLTCFSFDPIKNITCGEGGAICTGNDEEAGRIERGRILGISNDTWSRYTNKRNWQYSVVEPGFRYHLSNISAAIGLTQLERFDRFRDAKRHIAREYDEAFKDVPEIRIPRRNIEDIFPFFYVVRVPARRREGFIAALKEKGVATGIHYTPNHLQPLFEDSAQDLPVTERVGAELVTLPMFTEMTEGEVAQVVASVRAFFGAR
jgi:dTDP-4-amino-4,6-dideoxygalactose transaminase